MKFIWFLSLIIILNQISGIAKDYKGGELRTKEAYTYGRFEVRYKASSGSGQTSTFFTYHDFTTGDINDWNELDIEILGRYKNDIQFNAITPGRINHVHHQWVNFSPYTDFHNYAIEWTPEYIAWFIDGSEVYSQTGGHVSTLNKPQKIMMNIWNPAYDGWVGSWDDRILPLFAYYDWVSYASYTPGAGNTGTGNDFTLQWKDDFDIWNQSRWQKASHTFEGNNCDFTPENVFFKDGKMILCLTDNVNTGYVDHNPPSVLWARAIKDTIIVLFSEEVEKESAERTSNYMISGVSILSATLLDDNRTVKLAVSGMDLSNSYNLVVLGIKDRSPTPNTLLGKSVEVFMPSSFSSPLKINVGGSAFNDYLPDQEWNEEVEYGFLDGSNSQYYSPIHGTDEDQIYMTEHWGIVEYKLRVPNGTYKVTLMMAENYFDEAGSRVFDINVDGKYIVRNLDIYQEVGKNTAYNICADSVEVTDGIIDIHFGALKDKALLNGIIVESTSTGALKESNSLLNGFYLEQNYPNPFNSSTMITYGLKENSFVSMTVYNMLGERIETLINGRKSSGDYKLTWEAKVPSGIYFCLFESLSKNKKFDSMRKMVILK